MIPFGAGMKEESWETPWEGRLPPGSYSVGIDIGAQNGDREVMVIFDRKKRRIVKCFDTTNYAAVQVEQIREGAFSRLWQAAREWMAGRKDG